MHSNRAISLLMQYLQAAKRQAELARVGAKVPSIVQAPPNASTSAPTPFHRQRLARLNSAR